jgi:hypothetical protein
LTTHEAARLEREQSRINRAAFIMKKETGNIATD